MMIIKEWRLIGLSFLLILGGIFVIAKSASGQHNQMNPGGNIQEQVSHSEVQPLSQQTTEVITIPINPTTGADQAVNTLGYITSQSEANTFGTFATVKGALRMLPSTLAYDVTLQITDGSYTVGDDFFEGMHRISTSAYGAQLEIASASKLSQVGGTITSTIAGSIGGYSLTLTADPGYAINAYRGYWLTITSGTGTGQYKAIRSHNGVNYEVAGRFSPIDGTSQVQIHNESVDLTFTGTPRIHLVNNRENYVNQTGTIFSGLHITTPSQILMKDGSVSFDACEITTGAGGIGLNLNKVWGVELNNLIIMDSMYGVVVFSSYIRGGTTESSWLIRNISGVGVYLLEGWNKLYAFKGSVDDSAVAIAVEEGSLDLYNAMGTGNTIAVQLYGDSKLKMDISSQVTRGLVGTTTDVDMMGERYTYTEINNWRSATLQPNGNLNDYVRVLQVESSTTTGTGTLTYTLAGTTLAYTAPGDAIGAAVNIGAGGEFILKSNNTNWIQVWVNPTTPAGNTSDTFAVGAGRMVEFDASLEVY